MIDIERYKQTALKILHPIKPVDDSMSLDPNLLFDLKRSSSGRHLPPYYLVYFLLSNLLGYKDLGKFDKTAFSFPLLFRDKIFFIEYRKLGLGIFIKDEMLDVADAQEIVKKIHGAVKSVRPYFDYLAGEAVKGAKINIVNKNDQLYNRFNYFLKGYRIQYSKALKLEGKRKNVVRKGKYGEYTSSVALDYKYRQQANWLAITVIEAFYSWTEHLFIHLAVVGQNLSDGEEIAKLIDAEWKYKYVAAIPLTNEEAKKYYNELIFVRQQLRNFVAHGAFGKDGNAFQFHSKIGAVPVQMNHNRKKNQFSFNGQLHFDNQKVIELIEGFIQYLENGPTQISMYYTQKCVLPTILPYAKNGYYLTAGESMKSMKLFADHLIQQIDNSLNMDW